jgi:hypothetical protein
MAINSWLAIVSTIALAGCCVSGNGCYAPTPGAPIAWDGLGSRPSDIVGQDVSEQEPKRRSRPNREIIVGPLNAAKATPEPKSQSEPKSQADDHWTQEDAAALEADKKLTQQLKICSSC